MITQFSLVGDNNWKQHLKTFDFMNMMSIIDNFGRKIVCFLAGHDNLYSIYIWYDDFVSFSDFFGLEITTSHRTNPLIEFHVWDIKGSFRNGGFLRGFDFNEILVNALKLLLNSTTHLFCKIWTCCCESSSI